uniref:Chromatin assembly factor 1, subunit A (p150) n=1 Tax=Labrus bergylta TaxID=56723 RepID=A0A3Q3EMX6_9LABR
ISLAAVHYSNVFVFFVLSGMDCKASNNANKKLVQARLPFKRLNPEPKEDQPRKRPCAHTCPNPGVSDRENESSELPVHSGPPLVNGRGPLDGFLSRRRPAASDEIVVIDLTSENSTSPTKRLLPPPPASPCLPPKVEHENKDKNSSSEKSSSVDQTPSICLFKHELLCCHISLQCLIYLLQEQEERLRLQQEKERQKEEAKAAKEKKKEVARKLREEQQKERREKKEKEEQEKREKKEKEEKEKAERLKVLFYLVHCDESVLEELDQCLLNPAKNLNGLKDWIGQKPRWSGPTNPRQTDPLNDCVTVDGPKPVGVPDRKCHGPMKLLQFHGNYRPAYWGTWSKKSSHISPRCPLRQDKVLLDYEVDSDEEWEEEEPGESLSHSEGEDEEEGGEDDDDDGFFVPHGYLSNDEGALEEEEGGDLEKQKLRQTLKAREWDELMSSKKMKVLEPVVKGCVWDGEGPGLQLFQPYAVCLVEPLPKAESSPSPEELSQKMLARLLPLLHGNLNSSKMIISEFQEFCRQQASSSSPPALIHVKRIIKSNAVYEKRSTYRRCCWYVHTEVLSRFGLEALPVPCQWTYLTPGAREESREEPQAATGSQGNSPTTPQTSSTTPSSSNKRKSTGSMSITKFMKRCTDTEQTGAAEADGFQADNEDEDEEECVIVSTQSGEILKTSCQGDCLMEVTPSVTASLPVASAAPTLATA